MTPFLAPGEYTSLYYTSFVARSKDLCSTTRWRRPGGHRGGGFPGRPERVRMEALGGAPEDRPSGPHKLSRSPLSKMFHVEHICNPSHRLPVFHRAGHRAGHWAGHWQVIGQVRVHYRFTVSNGVIHTLKLAIIRQATHITRMFQQA